MTLVTQSTTHSERRLASLARALDWTTHGCGQTVRSFVPYAVRIGQLVRISHSSWHGKAADAGVVLPTVHTGRVDAEPQSGDPSQR